MYKLEVVNCGENMTRFFQQKSELTNFINAFFVTSIAKQLTTELKNWDTFNLTVTTNYTVFITRVK